MREPSTTPNYRVGIRTHYWDQSVAMLAQRIAGASRGAEIIILADETNGVIDVGDYQKLSHTNDFSALHLPNIPAGRVLWHNGDYPLYQFRQKFPNHQYYVMIENDVSVNTNLTSIIRQIADRELDFVATDWWDKHTGWDFYESTRPHFDKVMGCLMPIVIVSGRMIDDCLSRRYAIAQSCAEDPSLPWPFCEAFLASCAAELPEGKAADLRDFIDLPHFVFRPPIHIVHPWANFPGWISHPVLSGRAFVEKRLVNENIDDLFIQGTRLNEDFRFCTADELFVPLYTIIREHARRDLMIKYLADLTQRGHRDHPFRVNYALGQPANQSSIDPSKQANDTASEAARGVNGHIDQNAGFSTAEQINPWWQVNLGTTVWIDTIVIFLGPFDRSQCGNLVCIILSNSGDNGTAEIAPPSHISQHNDGVAIRISYDPPCAGQFVRISHEGTAKLVLDEVEVFGTVGSEAHDHIGEKL